MNLPSGCLTAFCVAGLAAGIASAESALTVAADTPSVEVRPRRAGRDFLHLPSLEYSFSVHAECGDDGAPESVSLSVADTRQALGAEQIGEDNRSNLTLRVPAKQIAPLVIEDFCVDGDAHDGRPGESRTIPGVLSVQASLLCRSGTGRKMIYATQPVDVNLVCTPGEQAEDSE